MIKKILVCFIAVLFFSCSIDDTAPSSYQELLAVESVEMPEVFERGMSYQISLTYLRPTNCHAYNGIYYLKYNNERTVAIISTVFEGNGNCETYEANLVPLEDASFNFLPTEIGSYIFKFWKGLDADGQDEYLIMEIPVIE